MRNPIIAIAAACIVALCAALCATSCAQGLGQEKVAKPAAGPERALAAASTVNVGIVCARGVASDKIVAVFRAASSMGFNVKGISAAFIYGSNFNPADFDVIILPAGTDEAKTEYELSTYADGYTICMGNSVITAKLQSFVSGGGGLVGIERGANYIIDKLGVLSGTKSYTATSGRSLQTITYSDSTFGSGTQSVFKSAGGGYLTAGTGATQIAKDSSNRTVIARNAYGSGRIVLCSCDLELRGDSLADWAQWDNWLVGGTHANSVGCWQLLGKLIGWADTGTPLSPVVSAPEPSGTKVAIVSSWYYTGSVPGSENYGGAAPYLLPAVARSVEYSGYVPVAIRFDDITGSTNRLTTANFSAVVFPGGFSYGYKAKLGYSKTSGGGSRVASFVNSGGGALGICAGSYYLSATCRWDGGNYSYLGIFGGTDAGPITHPDFNVPGSNIIPGAVTLVSTQVNDSQLYPTGNNFAMYQMIYGGGYKSGGSFTASTTYNSGYDSYQTGNPSVLGLPDAIRFTYGAGHVYLSGTHPEARCGIMDDWLLWDNYDENGLALANPDNPWTYVQAIFGNWLIL